MYGSDIQGDEFTVPVVLDIRYLTPDIRKRFLETKDQELVKSENFQISPLDTDLVKMLLSIDKGLWTMKKYVELGESVRIVYVEKGVPFYIRLRNGEYTEYIYPAKYLGTLYTP